MSLSKEELDAKIAAVQERFDAVTRDKEAADAELYRLQGEYRVLNGMKEQASDPATTVKAEPRKEVKSAT